MIILAAFVLVVVTFTCTLLSLRALGTRWPWEMTPVPVRAGSHETLHWVPTSQASRLHRRLQKCGFLVVNLSSINGMTLLAIYEVTW